MILSKKQITKALIRKRGCTRWSAPVLFANPRRQVFSCHGPPNPSIYESSYLSEKNIPITLSISSFISVIYRVGSHMVFVWIHCTDSDRILVDFSMFPESYIPRKLYTILQPTFFPIKRYQDILFKLLTLSKNCHKENNCCPYCLFL